MLAVRRLAHDHHARYLAHRIAGPRLPTELVDLVAEALLELQGETSNRLWKSMESDQDARDVKFQLDPAVGTKAEVAGHCELQKISESHNIHMTKGKIAVTQPNGKEPIHYKHLSSETPKPNIGMLVPGIAANAGGPAVEYAGGRIRVTCRPSTPSEPSIEGYSARLDGSRHQVTRFIQFDEVEAAMRQWHQESVENFVKVLGLKVVAIEGEEGGGVKPRLRLLQVVQLM